MQIQVGELIYKIREWVRNLFQDIIPEFLSTRRKMVLVTLGGVVLVLFLAFVAVILILNHNRRSQAEAAARDLADSFRPLAISPEELFLPDEPDFLPEVILEREPRETWTAEDAREFWTDPLKGKDEIWRNRAEKVIDDLMEGIP
ncbi:hypothetical protein TREPR_1516 [Treponema primitia ZAS-2]|uniref:Uncharacterized protein n=1 Tax=Treponema primitia (strain ATCC BAA-887 / DSM 12427 / ZAS-2) TaxID=545694 RepID=F5YPI2_TREPZ|nr:hypothetical protein [Treponema primitia]AEF84346.1 hypothetical protein TREPR_1516 [Treponema primitia ZAS-2]